MRFARPVLAVLLVCGRLEAGDQGVSIPGDDFVVTGDVKIRPGQYRIADANGDGVLHVRGDGTKLDLTDVELIGANDDALPDSYAGVGVSVDGAKDVLVTGGRVHGFKIGVRAHDAPSVRLVDVDASRNFRQHLKSTVEREDESDWLWGHENDDGHWERDYGAGISLRNCPNAVIEKCVVCNGQNGVLLDRCDKTQVFDGNYSLNSGWGIALWRTSDATICRNRVDFCVRGYSHGRYARGQDSAGIFVFEQCSRNVFALNSATHGGDGFFLYAGNETLQRTGKGGCNDNVLWRNDFSDAVANGIEATFSEGNRFVGNVLNRCDHAVWAGYSWNTTIANNVIHECANGVSIEHGHDNRITSNAISHCGVGVHLWTDEDPDLAKSAFGKGRDTSSRANAIERNEFGWNKVDVHLTGDADSTVERNTFPGKPLVATDGGTKCKVLELTLAAAPAAPPPFTSSLPGVEDPTRISSHAGRRFILVDDWGPVVGTTRLFPAVLDSVGAAKLSALGVDAKFDVKSLTRGFVAEPQTGELPATIVVRRTDEGVEPKPFELVVKLGADVHRAKGTIASMPWDVRFFKWTKDPREDAAAWTELLAGEPVESRRVDGLDFVWNAGIVSPKVGGDRFGTLATCAVDAQGKWRLETVSDDGIRVWVDDRLVVEDWTHHGPTRHDAELVLGPGRHRVRVEHFEIDGWALLQVRLVPVRN